MSLKYDHYLFNHKRNVAKGYEWIRNNLPELLASLDVGEIERQIECSHDASKTNSDEYDAYDAYFYGENGEHSYEEIQKFNKAWLLHIHRNPHHWQYWVLINDEPEEGAIALDMPYNYIIEMICDWWSFSWHTNNLFEIFHWYDRHKAYMKLSENTRKTVEKVLAAMKEKLYE